MSPSATQIPKEDIEKLKKTMCQSVNVFCDKIQSNGEEEVNLGLEELQENVNEALIEALFAQYKDDNQESSSLFLEHQREVRHRVFSGVHPEDEGPGFAGQEQGLEQDFQQKGLHVVSPEPQKPGESFCEWVLRLFQKMLQQLQKTWQAVLAWVQEKWASLLSAMKSIFSEIMSFCSNMAEYFSSCFQV
uniref:Matrix metallopeptidase 25 n=1 Tax=Molossus molossus TaxID=27622 RepID=A0A7J8J1H7_MOLMO|nr:matrix metallopeptidase 25 [Molossus molossus]